eukprot:1491005-Heterocapsa_arctica.AAC.1
MNPVFSVGNGQALSNQMNPGTSLANGQALHSGGSAYRARGIAAAFLRTQALSGLLPSGPRSGPQLATAW